LNDIMIAVVNISSRVFKRCLGWIVSIFTISFTLLVEISAL